ncbi:NifU family protein [Ferrovum myxofaciens]|jgi:Fe-S cluster biogenesis protein NfuA|uniref:NifU family protein n=3 Tax=root TaxID=1 RepID=A0A9E6MWE9_9PROT|nr:NifU family protein [Ferrovum myxofaciens]MBU6995649.1 NifU family protein [Ferrovum myxofaciens]QKE39876.2 MAG: NifU family protein [Ferrovum myxofaciens]QWY74856.1 MAG: NifU family protein [Ferrovum myxofaciens]QWY77605.1 MAG: NifU family protein [Ferrovum myxofaciens]
MMPKIADIEDTPNPNAIKFVLKDRLVWGKPKNYASPEEAGGDELASRLFAIPHVTNVFYADNWITVTQDGNTEWADLARKVAQPIREARAAEMPVRVDSEPEKDDDPRLLAIKQLLDKHIRPTLLGDGGDLEVMTLCGNVLCIRYYGTCGSCPSSQTGTLIAIENLVRTIEPEIEVVSV